MRRKAAKALLAQPPNQCPDGSPHIHNYFNECFGRLSPVGHIAFTHTRQRVFFGRAVDESSFRQIRTILLFAKHAYNVSNGPRTSAMSQYDEFAVNYHWLYSDYVFSGKPALEEHEDVLKDAGPKVRILDCSCGIGTFAIALAKLGYEVSGSDGSPGMIEQADLAARNANVDVPLKCCTWEDLPAHVTGPFDLIFCLGNCNRTHSQRRRNASVGAGNARRSEEWRQTRH